MLANEEDPEEFTVGRREEKQIVLHTYPGLIVPVARIYLTTRLSPYIEVRIGEKLEFNQERITTALSGDKRLVQASPLTLFALDLAAEARNVYVHQHTPRIRPPQCLVWSIWHSESYETWFPWPSIWASSPTELAKRAEQWSKAIRSFDTYEYEADELVDRVAFVWIRLHLLWLGESRAELLAFPESNTVMDEAWLRLESTLSSVNSKTRSSPWFVMELPLLTAPEYGLPEKRQTKLIQTLRGVGAHQELPPEWQDSRRKAVREAKRFPRGQSHEDLYEVFTDYQDNSVSEKDPAKALLDEIAKVFPNSPWSKLEDTPATT